MGRIRRTTKGTGFCFTENRGLCESKKLKCRKGQESAEGWDRVGFEETGRCLQTILCLILPGKHTGGPEKVRAWLKVTQQLVLGADLLAWGPGRCPPL